MTGWLYPWRKDLGTVARTLCKFMAQTSRDVDELTVRVAALEAASVAALDQAKASVSPARVTEAVAAVRHSREVNEALGCMYSEMGKGVDHDAV